MNERLTAIVGARITEFQKKMAEVKKQAMAIPNKIVVKVEAKVDKFENNINRMSRISTSLGTVMGNVARGSALMLSPSLVPMIASVAGGLGAVATSFGLAAVGAVVFGAVAIPTIAKLFGDTEKLTKAQKAARGEYDKFQKTWQGIVKDLEKPVLKAFSTAMQASNKAVQMARPLFDSAATAVNNLLTALNQSLDSSPVRAFFDYMNKQAGPMLEKIGKATGNFLQGIMSMMVAFGPLSESFANGFLKMSESFATWAAGLSKSEKFQSFITFVRENTPKVLELIGNLTTFIVNLGIGLTPLGVKVLELVNKFLAWSNAMMVAHPWIGKLVGVLLILTGGFMALMPTIVAVAALFEGRMVLAFAKFIAKVVSSTAIFIANTAVMIARWALLGAQALLNAAKVSAAWLLSAGTSMVTALASMVATAATFVAKWLLMGAQALFHAARMAAAWFIALGPVGWVIGVIVALVALVIANWDTVSSATSKAWTAVSKFVNDAATKILGYIQDKFPALYKVIMSAMQNAQKIVTAVWDYIKSTFENTLSFLKALVKGDFQGMKDAISNQMEASKTLIATIWSAIKSYFGTVISEIVSTVKTKFSDLVSAVQSKMSEVKSKVQEAWNNVKSYLQGINLFSIGANIIKGLVNGIKSMAGSVVSAAKNVVGNAISAAKSLLKIHSPSRVFKGIGQYTGEGLVIGMNNMKSAVSKASSNMAKAAMIEPQRTQFAFDAGLSTSDFGRIRHDVGAEVSGFEMDPTINVYNEWDGEKVVSYVERGNAKKSRITDGFYGK